MIRIKRHFSALIVAMFLSSFLLGVQEVAKKPVVLSKKEKQQVVKKIIVLLKADYVLPDKADQIGQHLKKWLKKKSLKSIKNPQAFAKAVTEEMQSVYRDLHLRVRVRRPRQIQSPKEDPLQDSYLQRLNRKRGNLGFRTVKVLDGNVGYLDFRYFGSPQEGKRVVASAMAFLENTDAMIIDMRKNEGGSPAMVQLVCSYFLEKKILLNSIYWRRGDYTQEFWTLDKIDGKRRPYVPLFVLTSKRTFSGAEEFSYNMLTQKRATLVGEVTGGGANPGGGQFLNDRFSIFIPTGRAINPITKTNWEGTGVKPHIMVDKDKAFDKALEAAEKAAEEFRDKKIARAKMKLKKFSDTLVKAEALFNGSKIDEATTVLNNGLRWGHEQRILDEGLINQLGYIYLGKKKVDPAITVFKFNVQTYPKSGNVYDSLGEAYGEKGKVKLAIKNYKKSFELDPNNRNALGMIKKFEKQLAQKKK